MSVNVYWFLNINRSDNTVYKVPQVRLVVGIGPNLTYEYFMNTMDVFVSLLAFTSFAVKQI